MRGSEAGRASARSCAAVGGRPVDAAWCLLLHVVRRGGRGLTRWRAPIHDAQSTVGFLEAHAEIQALALEQVGDLLQRLLSKVLHLENLALGLTHQVTQRADV